MTETKWPYGDALRRARGNLSAERAAGKVGMSRAAWVAWEAGTRAPKAETLKALCDEFKIPPSEIGYEAPEAWEFVPTEWIQAEFRALREQLQPIRRACAEDIPQIRMTLDELGGTAPRKVESDWSHLTGHDDSTQ